MESSTWTLLFAIVVSGFACPFLHANPPAHLDCNSFSVSIGPGFVSSVAPAGNSRRTALRERPRHRGPKVQAQAMALGGSMFVICPSFRPQPGQSHMRCGPKLNQGTAGFSSCLHLPGFLFWVPILDPQTHGASRRPPAPSTAQSVHGMCFMVACASPVASRSLPYPTSSPSTARCHPSTSAVPSGRTNNNLHGTLTHLPVRPFHLWTWQLISACFERRPADSDCPLEGCQNYCGTLKM